MSTQPSDPVARFTEASHDILTIETGYASPGYAASYLVTSEGRAAYVDTGVNASVPRLLGGLAHRGLQPEDVDWVLLTHVHLDHAGGAGSLMAALPNARLGVHSRGARHMIDPGPLMKAVRMVYGPEFADREYGKLLPVPSERVLTLEEGTVIQLGSRRLECIDSPGHCRHHVCIWDERSASWFTGDAFGLCLRDFRTAQGQHCVVPTTSPSQFEPEALHATVNRLLERKPRAVFPTHFGEVLHPERLAPFLLEQVDAQVAAVRAADPGPERSARLVDAFAVIYHRSLQAQGWQGSEARMREILGVDIQLNVDGATGWIDRLRQQQQEQQQQQQQQQAPRP